MNKGKKINKNENYRLIKKKHILPSIIGLIVTYTVLVICAIILINSVVSSLCDSKMEEEYYRIKYMADLYSDSVLNNPIQGKIVTISQVGALLDKEGRDYKIVEYFEETDENGKTKKNEQTVLFKGKDTMGSFAKEAKSLEATVREYLKEEVEEEDDDEDVDILVDEKDKIRLYYDMNETALEADSYGNLEFDYIETYKKLKKEGALSVFNSDKKKDKVTVPFYFWIRVELGDGYGCLYGKASYEIKSSDILIILVCLLALAILACFLFIAVFIRIIKRFINHRKLMRVFFTDLETKGHNWMWFTIKGEELLHKKKYNKLNYAVLNIVLVKYNTFCVCHSVEEGEEVLQAINRTIMKYTLKDEASAHYGMASFASIIKYSSDEFLKKKVKRLLKQLESIDNHHKLAFHIGIATLPATQNPYGTYLDRQSIDIEKVYNNACAATATLESSDDSAIAFFDDKLIEEQKWIDIVNEKQKPALENEEFVVYYQPKYNPSNDELRGAEALIRWQSPDYGFVTPGRFIPIFEKNGFITEIDHYMITHVARDQKRWMDLGYKCVPVSVNVSRAHFIEEDLAEQIRDAVDKEGAPRGLIEIELTESAFFDDKKAMINTIEKLKSYGFAVSMDDFGAGYSSLNSLKDMPLDVLKLDADFFRGESEGNRGEIVVSEAIRLAKALNMRTVAEGVEVKEQVDFLAKQGCDMIQGYYYAKPMTGSDYEQRMAQAQAKSQTISESQDVSEFQTVSEPDLATDVENVPMPETKSDGEPETEEAIKSALEDYEKRKESEP
ncbi:MAG: EAL domain-containing protein [Lachnospiraceae bacterium]|nr:EAL domain-containing protein [Lachnospiraceae bacterium]